MQGPSNGVGYSNITGGPAQTKVPSLTPKQLHAYHRIWSITTTIPYIEEKRSMIYSPLPE